MEISNNALAGLIVVAIFVVLVGTVMTANYLSRTGIPLTGQQIARQGTAQIEVEENIDINLNQDTTDFGIWRLTTQTTSGGIKLNSTKGQGNLCPDDVYGGSVWYSVAGCGTDTDYAVGDVGTGSWVDGNGTEMMLENTGGDDAYIDINSSTASEFLGGTTVTPHFNWTAINHEASSCTASANGLNTPVQFTHTQQEFCEPLDDVSSADEVNISYSVIVPENVVREIKTTVVEFRACSGVTWTGTDCG